VTKSIAALIGQFPKVQVNIVPEIAGLRFNFWSSQYIGFVHFLGAERFSYTRLLQAVDLSDQEPFGVDGTAAHGSVSLAQRASLPFACGLRRADGA
jgi:hypothetical protein